MGLDWYQTTLTFHQFLFLIDQLFWIRRKILDLTFYPSLSLWIILKIIELVRKQKVDAFKDKGRKSQGFEEGYMDHDQSPDR